MLSRSILLQILLCYACSPLRRKLETPFGAELMPLKHAKASVLVCLPYLSVETFCICFFSRPEYPQDIFALSMLQIVCVASTLCSKAIACSTGMQPG